MKCIGLKCPYCTDHLFNESCYICELEDISFKREKSLSISCHIDEFIKLEREILDELQQVSETIWVEQSDENKKKLTNEARG